MARSHASFMIWPLALLGAAYAASSGPRKVIASSGYTPGHGEITSVPGFDGPLPSKCASRAPHASAVAHAPAPASPASAAAASPQPYQRCTARFCPQALWRLHHRRRGARPVSGGRAGGQAGAALSDQRKAPTMLASANHVSFCQTCWSSKGTHIWPLTPKIWLNPMVQPPVLLHSAGVCVCSSNEQAC